MKPQLTPPQSMLLMKICERPCYVSDYYPPAGRLIKRGYAEFRGNILHPTEAGKALAKAIETWNAALAWHKNKTKE